MSLVTYFCMSITFYELTWMKHWILSLKEKTISTNLKEIKLWKDVRKVDTFTGNGMKLHEKLHEKVAQLSCTKKCTKELHKKVAWTSCTKRSLKKKFGKEKMKKFCKGKKNKAVKKKKVW